MKWTERYEDTAWVNYIKPTVDYVTRLAELIVLAAVFRVAADQIESLTLSILSGLLILVIGAYVGFPIGYLYPLSNRIKTNNWRIALAIALPLGLLIGGGAFFVAKEISDAVTAIAGIE
ncbi:hypothetical protein [Parasphingorhabdus sp.]|uniref:hypothetical protein n=1 Tax=Parasphingorhabdus sp. TaxID=2709688 RepID=UPI0032678186